MLDVAYYVIGTASGVLVGFSLGLVGGGGSIVAVPLMVYGVGVSNPHVAIGTSAFAVAMNSANGLLHHARSGTIKWRCAGAYAAAGVFGALAFLELGKAFDGQRLLFLLAIVMAAVGALMLRARKRTGNPDAECNRGNALKVVGYGFGTGAFSGFFGVGGGFLIVPGLVSATGMPVINAIGSSLVSVTTFGLITALSYAASGLIDWLLAIAFTAGGTIGGYLGARLAEHLSRYRGLLTSTFATLLLVVAGYTLWQSSTDWVNRPDPKDLLPANVGLESSLKKV
jgi:uncharacterized protein